GSVGYCAGVAGVEAETDVRVTDVWLAVDVGRVINPDGVINQVEGGAVQSASWALRERVRFDRTRITSVNWDTYPILRFTEAPQVQVAIVPAPGEPETGAGEIAQGPVAGASGNAVADAAGVRVRDLPLTRGQDAPAVGQSGAGGAGGRVRAGRWGSNGVLTGSASWMRRMASASAGATDRTVSLSCSSRPETGTVLVQTISFTSGSLAIFSSEPSQNSPCVQAMRTGLTPCSRSRASNSAIVVPRAISSSSTITSRPSTSPMMEVIATS